MENVLGLNRFGLLAVAIVVFVGSVGVQAADDKRWPPAGVSFYGDPRVPDISGLWLGTATGQPGVPSVPNRGPADGRSETFWAPWPLPFTPAYQKIHEERVKAAKEGRALADVTARCVPFGMPRMLVSKFYPDEIVQTPGQVTIFVNSTFPIVIWTDGRVHPKDLALSFNGHSIGHWVGDTLFVDTVGLSGASSLDSFRHPVSTKLNMKWKIQRVANDVLHVHLTLYDDDTFTEPVVTTNIWHRKTEPGWQILDDSSCFENLKTNPDAAVAPGFIKF